MSGFYEFDILAGVHAEGQKPIRAGEILVELDNGKTLTLSIRPDGLEIYAMQHQASDILSAMTQSANMMTIRYEER